MTKENHTFNEWFDFIRTWVMDATGNSFDDSDSVKADYENGLDANDVAQDIIAEYAD